MALRKIDALLFLWLMPMQVHLSKSMYEVKLVQRSIHPVVSSANIKGKGAAPAGCQSFNPSYIPASAHKLNQSGLLLRICCGDKPCKWLCANVGRAGIPSSACKPSSTATVASATDDEWIGFAPCDIQTGLCLTQPSAVFTLLNCCSHILTAHSQNTMTHLPSFFIYLFLYYSTE